MAPLTAPPPRVVRLVLVTARGERIGALPEFPVALPWWQEVESVVDAARARHGARVTVLRLLGAERPEPPGGRVTYLAEADGPVAAEPWDGALDDHPLRAPWARPGGPGADLAWADATLAACGLRRSAPAVQVRTWNLSSIWRLPAGAETAWLKVVPPFFAHEGGLLERLAGAPVPRLLGRDRGRLLLRGIPGADLYEAALPKLVRMVPLLVDLQRAWVGRTQELLALGLPDWRAAPLARAVEDVVARTAGALGPADRATLADFVARLGERFERIAACGVPETLVHGDFHPGNLRGGADDESVRGGADEPATRADRPPLTLLDWGDSGVGHPLLDRAAFLDRIPQDAVATVRAHWDDAWRAAVPGSDPVRAASLLAPVAAARQAAVYRRFLDAIEPSEAPYHAADPALWLRRAAALAR